MVWFSFTLFAYYDQKRYEGVMLPEDMHEVADIVDVSPVKYPAMDNGPPAFVVGANDFVLVAMKIYPQRMQVMSAQINIVAEPVWIALYPCCRIE